MSWKSFKNTLLWILLGIEDQDAIYEEQIKVVRSKRRKRNESERLEYNKVAKMIGRCCQIAIEEDDNTKNEE